MIEKLRHRDRLSLWFLLLYKLNLMDPQSIGRWAIRHKYAIRIDSASFPCNQSVIDPLIAGIMILGGYERPERTFVIKYLPKNEPIIELGASMGIVSCVTNKLLKQPHNHVVVEANPALIHTLRFYREVNSCFYQIHHGALAYDLKEITLYSNGISLGGSVYNKNGDEFVVSTITLQQLASASNFDHFNLICDIEGSEIDLINHELPLLQNKVGIIIMEFHEVTSGLATVQSAIHKLEQAGFALVEQMKAVYCFRNMTRSEDWTLKRPALIIKK